MIAAWKVKPPEVGRIGRQQYAVMRIHQKHEAKQNGNKTPFEMAGQFDRGAEQLANQLIFARHVIEDKGGDRKPGGSSEQHQINKIKFKTLGRFLIAHGIGAVDIDKPAQMGKGLCGYEY